MKSLMKNVIVATVTKILLIISSVVAQRFILKSFGSEINGLTASVSQFLLYFTILESGLGLASIQALYKPLADKDSQQIDGILSATSVQYRHVGILFLLLSVGLSVVIPFISSSSLPNFTVVVITFLMSLATVINYLFIGKYQVLLNADKKVYIIHTLDAVLGIGFSVIRIVMINFGYSIIAVQTIALLSPVVRAVVLRLYVHYHYSYLTWKAKPDTGAIGKRKFVLIHQLFGMVTLHAPATIITVMSTLSQVSVYSVYNLIYNNINNLVSMAFSTAVAASLGNLYESQRERFDKFYHLYELVFYCLLFCGMSTVFVMTIPFVRLYTAGVQGVKYEDMVLALLFLLFILFSTIRLPAVTLVNASGFFEETKNGAIVEAILSVVVATPCFYFFGLRGLMIGGCIAVLYRMLDIQIFVYKKILRKDLGSWIKKIVLFGVMTATYIIFFKSVLPINVSGWIEWVMWGVISGIVSVIWFFSGSLIWYRQDFIESIKMILKRR